MSRFRSVFVDKTVLDFNYVPKRLLHRDDEANFLSSLFRFIVDAPYEMSQRALIIGGVGSGKTALAIRLGEKLSLPVHHLDRLYWQPGWQHENRNAG